MMNIRDQGYLEAIQDFFQREHFLPSFDDIKALLGVKSKSAVARLVDRLKAEGYLSSSETGRLAPAERFFDRPVLGSSVPEREKGSREVREVVSIDQVLIKAPSKTVLLKVKDDAMKSAGLFAGDWVVVQRGAPAQPGDIVVGVVDEAFVIRFLAMEETTREYYLRAGNPGFPALGGKGGPDIVGRVIGAFRSY